MWLINKDVLKEMVENFERSVFLVNFWNYKNSFVGFNREVNPLLKTISKFKINQLIHKLRRFEKMVTNF